MGRGRHGPVSTQLCACGCGEFTLIGEKTGEPNRYVFNHHYRQSPIPLEDRFWARVDKTDGCWVWKGKVCSSGYGDVWNGGRTVRAHRLAWEFLRGPIPLGLTLDHLCRNRLCVNPDHLEPVTAVEKHDAWRQSASTERAEDPLCSRPRVRCREHLHPLRRVACVPRVHVRTLEAPNPRAEGGSMTRACDRRDRRSLLYWLKLALSEEATVAYLDDRSIGDADLRDLALFVGARRIGYRAGYEAGVNDTYDRAVNGRNASAVVRRARARQRRRRQAA